jgi:TPR repeat protein
MAASSEQGDATSRKAAEQGHAGAQFNLGLNVCLGGEGVPEDDAEAVKWYRKAAEQGLAGAQFNLGYNVCSMAKVSLRMTQKL